MFIGIVGQKFVGKDTLADYLCQNFPFEKKAFATGLKNVCKAAFSLSDEDVSCPDKKEIVHPEWGYSPRQLMQIVGTDLFRTHFDKNMWIKCIKMDLDKNENKNIIITDIRFENELNFVRNYCKENNYPFVIISITRNMERNETSGHASENQDWITKYKDLMIEITNNNSKDEFYQKIKVDIFPKIKV